MRMRALMVVAMVCLIAGLGRLGAADEDAKKDLKALQGNWKVTALTFDGKEAPKEDVEKMVLTIKDETYTLKMGDKKESGTIKLDPSEKPKTVDFVIKEGDDKGKTQHGIYTLEGDNLKFCMAKPGKDRPKELSSKEDSGHILVVLKRDKE
jgi:uncharacterized protein (TIGR03067 family)